MVFQSYALWPHMTVAQNVAFGLEERRLPARGGAPQAQPMRSRWWDWPNLPRAARASSPAGSSSAWPWRAPSQCEPRVLLLDEPLSNLDAKLRVHMRRELVALHRKLGVTTIFVTHDQEEAMTTCDRIAVMDEGVIQQVGTPVELFDRPVNRFVAEFVGTINLLPGQAAEVRGEAVQFVSSVARHAESAARARRARTRRGEHRLSPARNRARRSRDRPFAPVAVRIV